MRRKQFGIIIVQNNSDKTKVSSKKGMVSGAKVIVVVSSND